MSRSHRLTYSHAWYETETQRISGELCALFGGSGWLNSAIRGGLVAEHYIGKGIAANLALEGAPGASTAVSARAALSWYPMPGCEILLGYDLASGLVFRAQLLTDPD
jgi:hypothetical protein